MHCKVCDATFYMDSGGRLVLGDPRKKGGGAKSYQPTSFGFEGLNSQQKEKLKKLAPIALGVVLLFFAGKWLWSLKGAAPKTPEDFARVLGEAALSNSSGPFKSFATSQSANDAAPLLEKIRAGFTPEMTKDATQLVPAELPPEPGQQGDILVVEVLFIPPQPPLDPKSSSGGPPPYRVPFYFKVSAEGKYSLDATKSLEALARAAMKQ